MEPIIWKLTGVFPLYFNTFREWDKNVVTGRGNWSGGLRVIRWSDVKGSDVEWRDLCEVVLFWSEVKWIELRWSSWGQKYQVH
jgi:hypothetical protein